jgi:hypothetical protein
MITFAVHNVDLDMKIVRGHFVSAISKALPLREGEHAHLFPA